MIEKQIREYRKKWKNGQRLQKEGKDLKEKNKRKYPEEKIENGKITENSLIPFSVFCKIVSRLDIQKIQKQKRPLVFATKKTKVKYFLDGLFPLSKKPMKKSHKR